MVKVGDRVIVFGNEAKFGSSKEERNGVGVISDLPDREVYYGVTLDTGYYVAAKPENIHYNVEVTIYTTPPEKITQNGYEYSLVGPVKPEWLVDGAWVVRKDNGETHQINQKSENSFSATSSLSRVTGLTAKRVAEEFRPHEPNDWKWGDWAMYDGKRVFVVCPELDLNHAMISGEGFPDGLKYVSLDDLTPAF